MDQPEIAFDMLNLFLYGGDKAFQYSPQNLDRSADTDGECPSCPTCPVNFTNYDIDSSQESTKSTRPSAGKSSSGSGSIQLWIGLGLVTAFVVGLVYYKRKSARIGSPLNPIPTYDMEMRGSTYFDDPDDTDIAKETRED
jgi:hypothetical protein